MSYPAKLLPKPSYVIINTDKLSKKNYVCREVWGASKIELTDSVGDVKMQALVNEPKDFFHFSLDLYGICTENEFCYQAKDRSYNKPWSPSDPIPSSKEIKYKTVKDFELVFIQLSSIHRSEVEFFRYDKKGRETGPHDGLLLFEHAPTYCNFWHYIFKVYDKEKEDYIPRKKGSWRDKLAKNIYRTQFKLYSFMQKPANLEKPKKKLYKNNP